MAIDSTIYKMFKNDLQDCLTEEQKYYLELEEGQEIEEISELPLDIEDKIVL